MRTSLAVAAVFVAGVGLVGAQEDRAPRETVTATIGGKKVSIEYGRAALKKRALDELMKQLPEDRIWRAGADQVTTLTSETDLTIGGKRVPAGKYSVYVHCPPAGDYSLVLNKDLGIPLVKLWDKAPASLAKEPWPRLDGYQKNVAGLEVVRAPMKQAVLKEPVELVSYTFTPGKNGATLTIAWGGQSWSVDIKGAK